MTPREAGIQAFYADESTTNTLQGLNAAFDAYEAAAKTEADEWDGLDCGCGGGWKVGHMPGCPDAPEWATKANAEDLLERLDAGVTATGLHDDNETELFNVDDANDTMADAAQFIRSALAPARSKAKEA